MIKLLKIVGIIWGLIGLLNLVMMPWGTINESQLVFGLMVNMLAFITPGLILYGIGEIIKKKSDSIDEERKNKKIGGQNKLIYIYTIGIFILIFTVNNISNKNKTHNKNTHTFDVREEHKIKDEVIESLNDSIDEGVSYYENGQIKVKYQYKNGEKYGLWKFYYENGYIFSEIEFLNDKYHGQVKNYNSKGMLESIWIYENGEKKYREF